MEKRLLWIGGQKKKILKEEDLNINYFIPKDGSWVLKKKKKSLGCRQEVLKTIYISVGQRKDL